MDDILRRMLSVEKEAEALVGEKGEECRKLLEEARAASFEDQAKAQSALVEECREVREKIISAAEQERDSRLSGMSSELKRKSEEFTAEAMEHYPEIVRVLAGE